MEKTAEAILARSAEQRRSLSPWERGIKSMSPPGIDFDVAMQPSDIEDTPPPIMRRAAPHQDVDSLPEKQVQSPNDGINSGRLKSIIITPTDGRSEEQEEAREVVEIADDEETLLQFQSKKKKRSSNSIILRSPRLYPSILRGASSKKRKLSQIQHSPGNGKKRVDGETSKGSKTLAITKHGVRTGTTAQTTAKNPAIQLIPAMTRNQKGNRDSQPQQASTHQQGRKAVPLRQALHLHRRRSRIFGLLLPRLLSRSDLELLWVGELHHSPAAEGDPQTDFSRHSFPN